jgi:hypothetical protein
MATERPTTPKDTAIAEPKLAESNAFAFSRMFQSLMKPKLTQVLASIVLYPGLNLMIAEYR